MAKKTRVVDMVNGSIFKSVVYFVVPLILGNILQLLYNAADIIVVSRFAGSDAMASVGATGSLSALIISMFIGLSVGASVIVSRCYGARDSKGVFRAVHTSVLLGVVSGIVAMLVGVIFSKTFLSWMGTPKGKVLDGAVTYMKIYFIAVPASLLYNFGAAILRAIGDTKRPLYILAFSGMVNVILNLVLVIEFHLDVAGVAIATAVSNYISAIAVIFILVRADGVYRLVIKELRFYKKELAEILKVGLPAGIQSSVFSISNTLIQSAVNSFKAAAIAGAAAAANIEGFVYTAMNAFYQAAITGVSQNYGAKKEDGIHKSFRVCVASVTVVGLALGVLTTVFARPLLSIYITDSEAAIKFGIIRIIYAGLPYFLCGIMEVQAGLLRGIGYSTAAMVNSLVGACGLRVIWVTFILPLHRSPEMLFLCWPISWVVVIIMHAVYYMCVKKKAMQKMHQA
ncbi:MAG: MATE family efflux transporter [Clostridia bacterium]|nr:MATE family efflux transporter [Clostridia bacterium]